MSAGNPQCSRRRSPRDMESTKKKTSTISDWPKAIVVRPAARRRLEAARPPQFAVDLLAAKIPIETGCQGRAKRAASGGRDP
jgi:hypothetical protein